MTIANGRTVTPVGKRISRWHYGLARLMAAGYYRAIHVRGEARAKRPTLFIASHRNGATDGQVYAKACGPVPTLVSIQLLRHGFLRLLFDGIAVVREKDIMRYGLHKVDTVSPVQAAVAQIVQGGDVCILPEGSSEWQAAPLPYLPGMAVVAARLQAQGCSFVVQPLGIFYTCPDRFRSRVSIVRGAPFVPQGRDVRALQAELGAALNQVSVHCGDAAMFNRAQAQAWQACTHGADYGEAFLAAQRAPSSDVALSVARVTWWQRLAQGLFIAAWGLPVLAAFVAQRYADGRNNTTFFRLLGVFAVMPMWLALWGVLWWWQPWLALAWALAAWLGWWGWPEPSPLPLL